MSPEERALARLLFKQKILSSDGQTFEQLFTAVMEKSSKDFRQIKPQGEYGDRKNDGYDSKLGKYYQVYAPEDVAKSPAAAVSKIKRDFEGLKKQWQEISPIREFRFVLNDKYKGTFPTIEAELADIKQKHSVEECCSWLAKDLENELFALTDDEIFSVVGFPPDPGKIELIDYSILTEIILHIMAAVAPVEFGQVLKVPNFDEKIKFNGLTATAPLLITASYQTGIVDEYFSNNSLMSKQEVRDRLSDMYQSLRDQHNTNGNEISSGDEIFFQLLSQANPKVGDKRTQDATLVLMAHFFESCDIFDDPGEKE